MKVPGLGPWALEFQVGRADRARAGALVRGHFSIEARHHVEDVLSGDDAYSKVRSGRGRTAWPR